MINIDDCEFCRYCQEPLALVEECFDQGKHKNATVTGKLASRANIPAYVVKYRTDSSGAMAGDVLFRRVTPDPRPKGGGYEKISLGELGEIIEKIHAKCTCRTSG